MFVSSGCSAWSEVRGAILGLCQAKSGEQRGLPSLPLHSVLRHWERPKSLQDLTGKDRILSFIFPLYFTLRPQVFSRQAVQMDALISAFVDEIKQKAALYSEEGDNLYNENSAETDECLVPLTTVSRRGIPESCLSNKLTRLTLATFDDEGHCIGHMGSWSFSSW